MFSFMTVFRIGFAAAVPGVLAGLACSDVVAQSPKVHFDMHPVIACRDVTSPEFQASRPDLRWIEARFEVSALLLEGGEDDLLQFFYRLEIQSPNVSVADYWPKTKLASDQATNVTREQRAEKTNHVGAVLTSPLDWPGKVTASGDVGQKSMDSSRYELVPQMMAVTASGTVQRGRGVYYKMRPSRSSTLEGARRFRVVLQVPAGWRGGDAYFECTATGIDRGLIRSLDEQITCGQRRFVVALHREGDAEARQAAQHLIAAESDLVQTLTSYRAELKQRPRFPLRPRWESLFVSARSPSLLLSPAARDSADSRTWPPEVQQAVVEYQTARDHLRFLP
jgi:hypothetical protein